MTELAEELIGAPAEDAAAPVSSAPSNIIELSTGTVTLRPRVSIPLGIAALSVIKQGGSQAIIEAGLAQVYLELGIESWSYPGPVTPENIERFLPFSAGGLEVAERADALYSETVMRPLVDRLSKFLPPSPTASSMSATRRHGSNHRTPSGRSSRNGTAGKR